VSSLAASKETNMTKVPHDERLAAALPDARIAVVPGQGHVGDVLAPASFADILLAFLHGDL
jgi:pimeloyl-ACP methyl ester carboxylesterase